MCEIDAPVAAIDQDHQPETLAELFGAAIDRRSRSFIPSRSRRERAAKRFSGLGSLDYPGWSALQRWDSGKRGSALVDWDFV